MKTQLTCLCQNRRHAGAIVKLACAVLLTTTTAMCATDPDGVTLINQATVIAAGGFPYKITQPGSYRLSSDLLANTTAISIEVGDVTLDLNGFTVYCPCSGVAGIIGKGVGTTIRNGFVQGFLSSANGIPGAGIYFAQPRAKADHVTVSINTTGIYADNGVDLAVTDSKVSDNNGDGIYSGDGVLTVTNSTIQGNGSLGLTPSGIHVGGTALLTGNAIVANSVGVRVERTGVTVVATAATITNNVIASNEGFGVLVLVGTTAGIGSNTFAGNAADWNPAAVSMKNNVCGGSVC